MFKDAISLRALYCIIRSASSTFILRLHALYFDTSDIRFISTRAENNEQCLKTLIQLLAVKVKVNKRYYHNLDPLRLTTLLLILLTSREDERPSQAKMNCDSTSKHIFMFIVKLSKSSFNSFVRNCLRKILTHCSKTKRLNV